MEDLSKRCFLCMRKKNEANLCPCCGTQEISQPMGLLPLGSILGGRYYIGKARKQNSEGATYIAFDIRENRRCVVREYYPAAIAERDADGQNIAPMAGEEELFRACMEDFKGLWAKLMRLRGLTALISVSDLFSDNGTAYGVYEETEEETLRDRLLSNGVGYIPWDQARILFMPVLSTLATLHTSGVLHRGLNPEAFLVTENGRLKLTDFYIADARLCFGELDADIEEGYAPIEVYAEKYGLGAWTDVYSFTAVLYRALIGTKPIPAPARLQNDQMMIPAKFAEQLPPYVINAIINGMQIEPDVRTRNVEQLRSNLSASPRAVSASAGAYRETERAAAAANRPSVPRANDVYNPSQRRQPAQTLVDPPAAEQPQRRPDEAQRRSLKEPGGGMTPAAEQLLWEQRKREKTRKTLLILLCCLLVLAVAGLAILISGTREGRNTGTPETTALAETVAVPDFKGAAYDTVVSDSYYSQYFHFVKVEEYNASAPKGQILSQSVAPQTVVNRGAEVILYISAGPRTFELPDTADKTYEEAVAILSPMGLICERATKYNDGTREPDKVAETFPPAGSQVTQGDRITVILWASLEEETTLLQAPTAPAVPQQSATPSTVYGGESGGQQSSGLSGLLGGLFN